MDDNSNGPMGILYLAIGALFIALTFLAYFVLDSRAGAQNSQAPAAPAPAPVLAPR
jgi:hypothetical protein